EPRRPRPRLPETPGARASVEYRDEGAGLRKGGEPRGPRGPGAPLTSPPPPSPSSASEVTHPPPTWRNPRPPTPSRIDTAPSSAARLLLPACG
ncbi:hypothetical protein P7K49_001647, partial [Saguinus oedipus]